MCGGCLKVINWGWRCKSQKGALFIWKAGSHCVILLYCETLLQVLLGIYCKRFYWIPLFTILLLFCVFEVGKAKSATQSILMKHRMGYSRKIFKFLLYPWKFIILNPTSFPLCLFFSISYSVCTVISDWNHPFDKSAFTHSLTRIHYIIVIENTYLNGVFLKLNISIFP